MNEKPDFGATTAVIAYVRSHVTPKILWSAIGTLIAALVVAISWIVKIETDVAESKKFGTDMQQRFIMLQDMKTDIAVIKNTMEDFKNSMEDIKEEQNLERAEQNQERARWERVGKIAEEPIHIRKRRK